MKEKKLLDEKIFGGKKLSDLYQEIHADISDIKEQIKETLEQSIPNIVTSQDVLLMLPMINGLFTNGIKNTANLTKIAEILTKALSVKEEGETPITDDDMFKDFDILLKNAKERKKELTA